VAKNEEKALGKTAVEKMTVAQLNAALKTRNIPVPSKAAKKVLQDLLLHAESGEQPENEEPQAKGKGKRKARYFLLFSVFFFVCALVRKKTMPFEEN
jgi:hypothetical protein